MIILDTNVLSELMRAEPDPAVLRWMGAQPLAALHITTLTCAEILLGIDLMPEGKRRRQLAEQAEGLFAEDFASDAHSLFVAGFFHDVPLCVRRETGDTR